eukprot:306338_1
MIETESDGERQYGSISEDHFSIAEEERATLEFQNVSVEIPIKDPKSGESIHKRILNNVSGKAVPGEVLAVMGPSGSGKTTLLDLLALRGRTGTPSGTVLVNGQPRDNSFKYLSSYVPQEDNLIGTMSVCETMIFSANLNLGPSYSSDMKKEEANGMIAQLGLNGVANIKIGTVFQKGISGGQKRRVSIGVEIISKPKIIFLDEPTSGLDSAAAYQVMVFLKKFAKQGHSVVCTIHQPSSQVFHMIDRVLLLSG